MLHIWIGFLGVFLGILLVVLSVRHLHHHWHRRWRSVSDRREAFDVVPGTEATGPGLGGMTSTNAMYRRVVERFATSKDPKVAGATHKLKFSEEDLDTYTQDKKEMFLCMQDNNTEEEVAYIVGHEIGHAMSEQYDPKHETREFHDNFNRAIKAVTNKDFKPRPPSQHCGNVPGKAIVSALRKRGLHPHELQHSTRAKMWPERLFDLRRLPKSDE
jgi:hypothetical protein